MRLQLHSGYQTPPARIFFFINKRRPARTICLVPQALAIASVAGSEMPNMGTDSEKPSGNGILEHLRRRFSQTLGRERRDVRMADHNFGTRLCCSGRAVDPALAST